MKDNVFSVVTEAIRLMRERRISYADALALAKQGERARDPAQEHAVQAMLAHETRNAVPMGPTTRFSRETDPGREMIASVQARLRGEDVERHARAGRPVRPTPIRIDGAAAILFGRSGLKIRKGRRPRFRGGETYSPPADLVRNSRDDKPVKMGPCACSCTKSASQCNCC